MRYSHLPDALAQGALERKSCKGLVQMEREVAERLKIVKLLRLCASLIGRALRLLALLAV